MTSCRHAPSCHILALLIMSFWISMPLLATEDSGMGQKHPGSLAPFDFKATYSVEDGAIVSHNGARFFNRPLYAPNIPAMAFAGDKPQMRFIDAEYCYGTLLLGYAPGESSKWLHEFDHITTRFYPARVVWEISDSSLEGLRIRCEAAALAVGNGMTLKFLVEGQQTGDDVIWAFGGATPKRQDSGVPTIIWELDPSFNPAQTTKGLTPESCAGNRAEASGEAFVLTPPPFQRLSRSSHLRNRLPIRAIGIWQL